MSSHKNGRITYSLDQLLFYFTEVSAFFKCACIAFIVFKNIILNVFIHTTIINHVDAVRKPMY